MLDSTIFIFTVPIYLLFVWIQCKKNVSARKQLIGLVFYIYIWKVIDLTLFPLPVQKESIEFMQKIDPMIKHNWIPFYDTYLTIREAEFKSAFYIIGGNIALLIPFGFLYSFLVEVKSIKKIGICSFLVSLSIEASQYLISLVLGFTYRSADINDLMLNTLGGIVGYIAYQNYFFIKNRKNLKE